VKVQPIPPVLSGPTDNSDMTFVPHAKATERRASAIQLVKMLLKHKDPLVLRAHIRELLTTLLWKITEADSSKYKTRYQSQGAIERSAGVKLQHEHVYQRAKMIDALLIAEPDQIDEILGLAVGCTVTTEEATLLAQFDSDYGWERYRKAGITVLDTKYSPAQPVDLSREQTVM
jgi:hypothetical protein